MAGRRRIRGSYTGGAGGGGAAPFATLPTSTVDITMPSVTGSSTNVTTAGGFATALAAIASSNLNNEIVLTANFTGPITLTSKSGTGWTLIRSDNSAWASSSTTRITAATNMRKITAGSSPLTCVITSGKATKYRLTGIEMTNTSSASGGIVRIGNGESASANLPTDIILDRCYIHGDVTAESIRGIQLDGNSCAVINSYLFDFKSTGSDTQAIASWNSEGPLRIENCYLEATGENVMFGGADPSIANLLVSDVEIRKCYFKKLSSWVNTSYIVKNLFESKFSRRVLIEKCDFDGCWQPAAGQDGTSINIKTANHEGSQTWAQTRDLTIRYNKFHNVENWIKILDKDPGTSLTTTKVYVHNNLALLTTPYGGNSTPGNGRPIQLFGNLVSIKFEKNTALILASASGSAYEFMSYPDGNVLTPMSDMNFIDNIWSGGDFGFDGPGANPGTTTLNQQCSSYSFTYNAIIGVSETYPATNIKPASTAIAITDAAGGDYTAKASGPCDNTASDGTDMGCDVATVQTYAAAAISGA